MIDFNDEIVKLFNRFKSGKNFSFSKYADGEWLMMNNIPLDNNEFKYTNDDVFYRDRLIESFKYRDDEYYVGISCPCCQGKDHILMKNYSNQDSSHLTFANIFVNNNYEYYKNNFIPEYSRRSIYLVANKNAKIDNLPFKVDKFYPVSDTAWKYNYDLIDSIKNDIAGNMLTNKVFLFACGPFGNMLAHQLWVNNKCNTYIDVGSTLNPWIQSEGFKRDYYMGINYNNKVCKWG